MQELYWESVKDKDYTDILYFPTPRYTQKLRVIIRDAIESDDDYYTDTCISTLDIFAIGTKEDREVYTGYFSQNAEDINGDPVKFIKEGTQYLVDLDDDEKNELIEFKTEMHDIDEDRRSFMPM